MQRYGGIYASRQFDNQTEDKSRKKRCQEIRVESVHERKKKRAPYNVKYLTFFSHKRLQSTAEEQLLVNGGKQNGGYHQNRIIAVCQSDRVFCYVYPDKSVKRIGKRVEHKRAESEYKKAAQYCADIAETHHFHSEKLFVRRVGRKFFQQIRRASKQSNADYADYDFFIRKIKQTENGQNGAHDKRKYARKYSLSHKNPFYLSRNKPSSVIRISTRTSNLPRGSFFSILSA